MRLIDSHCHLDLSSFDDDRQAVLDRSLAQHVSDIIVPAVEAAGWEKLQHLCQDANPVQIHAAYGLHPVFEQQHEVNHLDWLDQQLSHPSTIAVGECGLDFFIKEYDKQKQLALFTGQLDLAVQHQLPLVIHSRKSLDFVLKELRLRPGLTGVIHSYSGSYQQAKQLIDLGFYLGFGGPITYTRAKKLRGLVVDLPLESLLLETDSPDQPDLANHGKRNEPSWLMNIASCIATLRNTSVEQVAEVTTNSAQRLFRI